MAKRINKLSVTKTVPSILDVIAIDTPTEDQGETYKMTIQDFAAAFNAGLLTGDMLKSVYDVDNSGVVDGAQQLQVGGDAYVRKSVNDVLMYAELGIISINAYNDDIYMGANNGAGKMWLNSKEVLTSDHISASDNPHQIAASDVGLENVDNTSDANKPVSLAQDAADKTRIARSDANNEHLMNSGYTPNANLAVATKGYVDSKVSSGTYVYVANTVADMYLIGGIQIGDRCIVTADPTPSLDGEYVCIQANSTPPSGAGHWQKQTIGAGDLYKNGSVPMDPGYTPTEDSKDIADTEYVDARDVVFSTAAIAYTDANVLINKGYIDTNTAAILALKTQYISHTWAIPVVAEGDSPHNLTPMILVIPSGEVWSINKVAVVSSFGDFDVDMQEDGVDIPGWTQLTGATTVTVYDLTEDVLTNESLLRPIIQHQQTGGLTDVTITIEIKKVRS